MLFYELLCIDDETEDQEAVDQDEVAEGEGVSVERTNDEEDLSPEDDIAMQVNVRSETL